MATLWGTVLLFDYIHIQTTMVAFSTPPNAMAGGNRIRERGGGWTLGEAGAHDKHTPCRKRIWIGCLGGDLDSHPKIWSLGAEEEFWEDARKQS